MLDLLLPPRCLACRVRATEPWCDGCRAEVRELPAGCPRCAGPARVGHGCWAPEAPVDATVARYAYEGPVAAAIVAAKVGGAHRAWGPLAAALAPALTRALAPVPADLVTWVTTVPARVRARGRDHAGALAAALAAELGLPVGRTLRAEPTARHPEDLVAERRLDGARLVLVDDVLTTGRTALRAAGELRRAGADRIVLAVLARAGAHDLRPGAVTPPPRPA